MIKKYKWFWLIVLLQLLLLTGMVTREYYTLNYGKTLILETRPYDPWDLFRGNYLRLNYSAGEIELDLVQNQLTEAPQRGKRVFVYFKPGQPATPELISATQLAPAPQGLIPIKARVGYAYESKVGLAYGIENYFIPEELANREREFNQNGRIRVVVKVDRYGHAVIGYLSANGGKLKF